MKKHDLLAEDTKRILQLSQRNAQFFVLPKNTPYIDITNDLLNSPFLEPADKTSIRKFQRKFYVFTYPSDGLHVKGLISITPKAHENRTLIYLRGGNREFGLFLPGEGLSNFKDYTFIAPLYRGCLSEGKDEFGGKDVNDVKKLIDFLPALENLIGQLFQKEKMFLVGSSRGGMQLFLTLARFPELQGRFSKVLSLCGLVDMRQCIENRQDMKELFQNDFGMTNENIDTWLVERDPLIAVEKIRNDLPVIIVHGTADLRVSGPESWHMVETLRQLGKNVQYYQVEGGSHGLTNIKDKKERIFSLLDNS